MVLGGSRQAYLPTKDGQVVAICLNPKYNPDAPHEILVGDGPKIQDTADLLVAQQNALPTFVKKKVNEWEYVGKYRAVSCMTGPKKVGNVPQTVTRVIKLDFVSI